MLSKLREDLHRYIENGKFAFYEPSIVLLIQYRICQSISKIPVKIFRSPLLIISTPLYVLTQIILGIILPKRTQIGGGLRIYHYSGIVLNPNVKIGKNCSIRQGVTIGNRRSENDCPIIGDNCNIGAGAKILGSICIGNNVSIGANAVVLNDVPDNATAIGVPARIILKK